MVIAILKAIGIVFLMYVLLELLLLVIGIFNGQLSKVSNTDEDDHDCMDDDMFYLGTDDLEPIELERRSSEPKSTRKKKS